MDNSERIPHDKLLEYLELLKKEKYIENYNINDDKFLYGLLSKSITDNKIEEVKYILLHNNNIDDDLLYDLIWKSIVDNKLEYVKCIILYINNMYSIDLDILLKSAYKYKRIEIAEYLISEGANVEVLTDNLLQKIGENVKL